MLGIIPRARNAAELTLLASRGTQVDEVECARDGRYPETRLCACIVCYLRRQSYGIHHHCLQLLKLHPLETSPQSFSKFVCLCSCQPVDTSISLSFRCLLIGWKKFYKTINQSCNILQKPSKVLFLIQCPFSLLA